MLPVTTPNTFFHNPAKAMPTGDRINKSREKPSLKVIWCPSYSSLYMKCDKNPSYFE